MNFQAAGQLIRQARQAKGLTQKRLATSAGVDDSYLSKIENGTITHAPKADVIDALSQQLGLSPHAQAELRQHYGKRCVENWLPSTAFLLDYIG